MPQMTWETYDLWTTFSGRPYDLTGSYGSAYANVQDTKFGGSSSWKVNSTLSVNTCYTSYCTY